MQNMIEVVTTIINKQSNISTMELNDGETSLDNENDNNMMILTSDKREMLCLLLKYLGGDNTISNFIRHLILYPNLIDEALSKQEDQLAFFYHFFLLQIGQHYPKMNNFQNRISTYNSVPIWPYLNNLSSETMALWGFYRKEPIDKQKTCCFACGCSLGMWEENEIINPYSYHKWSSRHCPWIALIAFVEKMKTILYYKQQQQQQQSNETFPPPPVPPAAAHGNNPALSFSINFQTDNLSEISIRQRLEHFVLLNQQLHLSAEELIKLEADAIVLCRDYFHYPKENINYVLWRKLSRYYIKQALTPLPSTTTAATTSTILNIQKEIPINLKTLFKTSVDLVEKIRKIYEINSELHAIYPDDGGLTFVEEIKQVLTSEKPIRKRRWSSRNTNDANCSAANDG